MNKDKNKQPTSIYPDASRGPRVGSLDSPTLLSSENTPTKVKRRFELDAIGGLYLFIVSCLAIGIIGYGAFAYTSHRATTTTPKIAALKIAQKVAEDPAFRSAETYQQMQAQINQAFSACPDSIVVTITHHYNATNRPGATSTSTFDTRHADDVSLFLMEIAEKVDATTSNSFDISCAG